MQNRFVNPIQIAKKYISDNKFGKIINITTRVRWSRNQKYIPSIMERYLEHEEVLS